MLRVALVFAASVALLPGPAEGGFVVTAFGPSAFNPNTAIMNATLGVAGHTIEDFEEDPNVIIVRVDAYNTFHVATPDWEQEAPSEQELLIKLREARERSDGNVPSQLLVIANGEALYERVVTALDAGAAVGMDGVKLVTVEEDQE